MPVVGLGRCSEWAFLISTDHVKAREAGVVGLGYEIKTGIRTALFYPAGAQRRKFL